MQANVLKGRSPHPDYGDQIARLVAQEEAFDRKKVESEAIARQVRKDEKDRAASQAPAGPPAIGLVGVATVAVKIEIGTKIGSLTGGASGSASTKTENIPALGGKGPFCQD